MPKHDVGSAKWLGNKMKAAGLMKLRWYCQMCEKQCKDENGFKCHQTSEIHMRNMELFCENPTDFIDKFSDDFEKGFMDLLSTRYCKVRMIKANTVYQDYIRDRNHLHMNSTIWATLSNFVEYLIRTNKVEAERDKEGRWCITWIDPEEVKRKAEYEAQEKVKLTEAEKEAKHLAKLVSMRPMENDESEKFTKRDETKGKVQISLGNLKLNAAQQLGSLKRTNLDVSVLENAMADHVDKVLGITHPQKKQRFLPTTASTGSAGEPQEVGAQQLQALTQHHALSGTTALSSSSSSAMKGEDGHENRFNDEGDGEKIDHDGNFVVPDTYSATNTFWISPGLIVKILDDQLKNGKYYKKKGTIIRLEDPETADVKMHEAEKKIRIPQKMLETVIPKPGRKIRIVAPGSKHQGKAAVLEKIDEKNFCCAVKLVVSSADNGSIKTGQQQQIWLDYEDICKIDEDFAPS
ncbi:unnamed protein product [Amoebophrya sp. A120]|nr:unnamed protein product [Amoebophrya sp. A120]|eukprot:GSA120T00000196001.1